MPQTPTLVETMTRCTVCNTRTSMKPARVCETCRRMTHDNLVYLPRAAKALTNMLQPGTTATDGQPGAARIEPQLPLNVHILSLIGQDQPNYATGNPDDQHGSPSILAVLGAWQRAIWQQEQQGPQPPAPAHDTPKTVDWLIRHLNWAVIEFDPYPDMHNEIARTAQQCLRTIAGDRTMRPWAVGKCPAPAPTGARCGWRLMAHPEADDITCTSCGSTWQRHQWPLLSRLIENAGAAA